jgi:hypothetical protein
MKKIVSLLFVSSLVLTVAANSIIVAGSIHGGG